MVVPFLVGVLGGTPDTYQLAGLRRGTATSKPTTSGTTSGKVEKGGKTGGGKKPLPPKPRHLEPGQAAVDTVRQRIAAFERQYATTYPQAVRCLLYDVESLTIYLRFSKEHWRRIRHSNFIERTFGETRRRVKVIGRLPGERSCLSLVFAVLDRASRGWRGVQHNPATTRLLADLRRQLLEPPASIDARRKENVPKQTDTAVA